MCCLAVIVVSEQVLFDLKRFFTTLIKNQFFFKKKVFVMVFGHENHFQAVFSTLQQILTFFTAFQFLCCLTVLVVCERVLNDLKRFDTNLVNKLFKNILGPWS